MLLISIRPKYVDLIATGAKRVELRRRRPRLADGPVLVYASAPQMELVGTFQIAHVLQAPLQELWRVAGPDSGITREAFDRYFCRCPAGVGIGIRDFQTLEQTVSLAEIRRRWPDFHPPQAYRYLAQGELERLRLAGATLPTTSTRRTAA